MTLNLIVKIAKLNVPKVVLYVNKENVMLVNRDGN